MPLKPPHITIVGAGLGGLCLAQGLRQQGIAFDVYERDAALASRTQGYRIRIDHAGQQALKACLPAALFSVFQATGAMPVAGVNLVDTRLEAVSGKWVESWRRARGDQPADTGHGESADAQDLSANRQTLREVLMHGIEDRVHFGKAFVRYREDEDARVKTAFSDGSCAISDVLVAADGINSLVRRRRLPGAVPADTGFACLYGKTYATPATLARLSGLLPARTSIVFGDGLAVIVDPMRFRPPPAGYRLDMPDDYLYWAIIGAREALGIGWEAGDALQQDALAARLERITTGWHAGLRALFQQGDRASLAMMPIRTADVPAAWPSSAVTVLGDAIHAMSPAGGLGANTALHDAFLLSRQLGEAAAGRRSLRAAIGGYEAAMREHSARAILASLRGTEVLLGASGRHPERILAG
ncbi:FAD-dependent oxidoreductase [Cupriavidus basilensis]|uniref:FAD-dependent oxidoreductase n=1 Tax=Cupriavidus basilensis TaxID=68895 RepID=UPI00192AE425|nr:NAD(P)/FAD-dependent oxidoreductase [Cupriavidus basilensis]